MLATDRVLQRLQDANVPGAAVARITAGEVEWAHGYGMTRAVGGEPVQTTTVFGAASVSKAVTALGVLALAEAGKIDLDGDVRPLLSFPLDVHPKLRAPAGGLPPVTPRLLLQHRGGVIGRGTTPRLKGDGFLPAGRGGGSQRVQQRPDSPDDEVGGDWMVNSWSGASNRQPVCLTYAPGTLRSYSGAGYLVLQHLVEVASGQSFEDYLGEVMRAYGATQATFALRPSFASFASGHDPDGNELPGGHELVPWAAAGGLYIDIVSLAAILRAVLRNEPTVPGASLHHHFINGCGTVSVRLADGRRAFRHGGDNGGYRAVMTGVHESGDGVVVLTNGRAAPGTNIRTELAELSLQD